MIHAAMDVPWWAILVPAVGIFTAIGAGITAGIASGAVATGVGVGVVGAGLATIARHIQGFVEGNPWWEDPLGDFKQQAIGLTTGAVSGGLGGAIGPALGAAVGSQAANVGAQSGLGSVIPTAVADTLKQGAQGALTSGALGAARSAISGEDPLMGGAMGAAGGFVGGAGNSIAGNLIPGSQGPIAGPPAPSQGFGADLGRAASTLPARAGAALPGLGARGASFGVGQAMAPGAPPPPPQDPFQFYNRPQNQNPLYRYDRY